MFKKGNKSQIATIIVFIIAVIFLFAVFSINMSMMAQKKTHLDNIVDSVGLQLASQFASMGHGLKQQLGIYGTDIEKCDPNWDLIIGIGLIIGAAICAIASFGTSLPLSGQIAAIGIILAVEGTLFGTSGANKQYIANNPGALQALQLKFQNLSTLQQITEMPIESSIFQLIDDPATVTDTLDMDRDHDTTDQIPRSFKWYILRLNSFTRVGNLVRDFLSPTLNYPGYNGSPGLNFSFFKGSEGEPRFYFQINPNNFMAEPDDPAITGNETAHWMIDSDNNDTRDLWIASYLRNDLSALLIEIRTYGYGLNVNIDSAGRILNITDTATSPYEAIGLPAMINEIEQFESSVVRSLRNMDFDTAVWVLDAWLPVLRSNAGEDWHTRLGTLLNRVTELRDRLEGRIGQIHDCVSNCKRKWISCWKGPKTPVWCTPKCKKCADCDISVIPPKCLQWHYYTCRWISCDGPFAAWQNCGTGCGGICSPTHVCTTPLPDSGGSTTSHCCEIAPTLEPDCTNSNSLSRNNIIRTYNGYDAIIILNSLIDDIVELRSVIQAFQSDIVAVQLKSYADMHEAYYVWEDFIGGQTGNKQPILHIAYVNVESLPNTTSGFTVPHFNIPHGEWLVWNPPFPIPIPPIPYPAICYGVGDATGRFRLTVARFDDNSRDTGPLSKFWRFIFGRGSITMLQRQLLQTFALQYKIGINSNTYIPLNAWQKSICRNILIKNGMGTRTTFHYGPGRTYDPNTAAFPGPASERNRDTYIESTTSSWWGP
jgi:hypothetical protein